MAIIREKKLASLLIAEYLNSSLLASFGPLKLFYQEFLERHPDMAGRVSLQKVQQILRAKVPAATVAA